VPKIRAGLLALLKKQIWKTEPQPTLPFRNHNAGQMFEETS